MTGSLSGQQLGVSIFMTSFNLQEEPIDFGIDRSLLSFTVAPDWTSSNVYGSFNHPQHRRWAARVLSL